VDITGGHTEVSSLRKFCDSLDIPFFVRPHPIVGIIENMSGFICPHCGEKTNIFGAGGGQAMAEQLGVPLLGHVPIAADVTRLGDEGRPLLGPDAPLEVKQVYEGIVERLVKLAEG